MSFYTKVTSTGAAKIAAAIANGTPLKVTHMRLGDGAGNPVPPPTGTETELVREVYAAPLNRFERLPDLLDYVEGEMVVPAEVGGFVVREIALSDEDEDVIAYGNFPANYKPAPEEGVPQEMAIRTSIKVSTDAEVTLLIDPNIIMATRAWVSNSIQSYLHVPAGGSIGQVVVKTGNEDGDYQWQDPTQANVIVQAIPEPQLLADLQTVVTLAVVTTLGTAYYVDGKRLSPADYTVDSPTQLTLAQSYPANTKFLAVQNEPNGTLTANQVLLDPQVPDAQTVQQLLQRLNEGDPAGRFALYAGPDTPPGWLDCDFSEYSRTGEARLFAAIGTTWGEGDGSTTFNVPNSIDNFVVGAGGEFAVGDVFGSQNKAHTHEASSAAAGEHSHAGNTSTNGDHSHKVYGNTGNYSPNQDIARITSGQNGHENTSTEGSHNHTLNIQSAGDHSHSITVESEGGPDARPRGMAVKVIIRR